MVEAAPTEPKGSVIAFEGHSEIVSTQLRLLPTSPHVLILPGVQCFFPDYHPENTLQAHAFIRKAHQAVLARHETACSFLKGSPSATKRLVFMNGGTSSAEALCIKHIMQHETDGDHVEAEEMFNFLVREGLAGLETQSQKWFKERANVPSSDKNSFSAHPSTMDPPTPTASPKATLNRNMSNESQSQGPLLELIEDPITRAMRAAEALDRETANLQVSNELDLTLQARPRSLSLPMYGYSDNFGDAAPFFVFGSRRRANSDASVAAETVEEAPALPANPNFRVVHYEKLSPEQSVDTDFVNPLASPSCSGESYGPTFLHSPLWEALPTSRTDTFDQRSPPDVVFGEASLVDVRLPVPNTAVPRIRSLDRLSPRNNARPDLTSNFDGLYADSDAIRRPQSVMVVPSGQASSSSQLNLIDGPRTIVVRSKPRHVVSLSAAPNGKKRKAQRSSYVDRGTDAGFIKIVTEPYTPVLPLVEDLVISFKDDAPDLILESSIQRYRGPLVPKSGSISEAEENGLEEDQVPGTPTTQSARGPTFGKKSNYTKSNYRKSFCTTSIYSSDTTPLSTPEKLLPTEALPADFDEYDPFAYVKTMIPPNPIQKQPASVIEGPPTPEKTPVPSVRERSGEKFQEFEVAHSQTAVAVQNSLRSALSVHFPPKVQGYRQFSFALLPELEGLWNPIFREAEPGSPRTQSRRMDQILAIGSQRGVLKEYSSAIIGLLDKIGTKKTGKSRSGKLDFRYLLANAMQVFTAQPLTSQTSDNPFNNPYLLATLLVPHLETYLALHSEVRYLLLEYPPEHLPTVLALQRLVGVDLMKVAQIVDSESSDIGPFTRMRGSSLESESKLQHPLGKPVGPSAADFGVSKANYLLTSSASDTEIATFIATIRKILTGVSAFYVPEEPTPPPPAPAKKQIKRKDKPTPLSGPFSPFPRATGLTSPTATSPTTTMGRKTQPSPGLSQRPASIAETVRTFTTARTAKSGKSKRFRRVPTRDGAESCVTYDPAEDSDYDQEERRLMPIFMQKASQRPKPSSRKALKFLGLA